MSLHARGMRWTGMRGSPVLQSRFVTWRLVDLGVPGGRQSHSDGDRQGREPSQARTAAGPASWHPCAFSELGNDLVIGLAACSFLSAGVRDFGSEGGHADVDSAGWVGAPVDLGELGAG